MPEHAHLIIVPNLPQHPLDKVLASLKRPVAQRVIRRWRELNAPILKRITGPDGRPRFWQRGGGYDRNIISDEELFEKIDYIHENPVRRGLVKRAIDWPWSSAMWYAHGDGLIAMDDVG